MEISIGSLRRLRLSPNALAAALCLIDNAQSGGRVLMRTADLADEFRVTARTMQTAVRELIEAGFMTRIVRGVYQIHPQPVSEDRKSVSEEEKPVSELGYVRTTSTTSSGKTETPDGVSAAPSADGTTKGITLIRYDDGDDLAGVGMTEPKSTKEPRKASRVVPKMHRSVPREQWTMAFVIKEINHRLWLWERQSGKTLPGGQTSRLPQALNTWAKEYGVTPQEAAALCDRFFDDPAQTSRFGRGTTVMAQFLHYVKVNLFDLRGTVITDEFRESLENQEVPW